MLTVENLLKTFPVTRRSGRLRRKTVDLAAARSWLAAGAVAVGVGSPLTGECLVTGDFAALRTRARAWLGGWPDRSLTEPEHSADAALS
ncbi:hypothetical protein [Amycolatopsis sp. NPDC051061]|uniref:hypothetical protein n=1 Tax=Amycolatopsis sp. NPDC051061 TaxID=3155042 RepID=UPI0034324E91